MLEPGEERQAGERRDRRRQFECFGVVGAGGVDGERRVVVVDRPRGGFEVILGDVHRHVGGRGQGVEQDAHLRAAAAAVLHQTGVAAGVAGDGALVGIQNRHLGARQVVLRQPGDGVEELGAGGIVEVLRRNGLARLAQAAQHLARHVRQRRLAVEQREAREGRYGEGVVFDGATLRGGEAKTSPGVCR